MDKIKDLMNNLDNLEKFIPKLDSLLDWSKWLISLAVRVGPVCILVLGLIYLLIPPKEANRKAGYRTYFGMGSILAWRFTQRVSGVLMSVVGLILTIIAFSTVGKFDGMETMEMANLAIRCVKGQIICALIIWIFMFILTAVMFDRQGYRRFPFQTNTILDKFFFLDLEDMDPPMEEEDIQDEFYPEEEAYIPEGEYIPEENEEGYPEEEYPEYEQEGEQPITADDIVIESLEDE